MHFLSIELLIYFSSKFKFIIVIFQWLVIPFAMTNDAVTDISVNYTTVWIKEVNRRHWGYYIDSYLLIILGGMGWQVCICH